ncbi:50S ribosomal protein L21, partial [Vibrio sp. 03_296]
MYAVFPIWVVNNNRVSEGQTLRLEKLDVETGATVEFDKVLLVANGED